jgi:hypothetical protein
MLYLSVVYGATGIYYFYEDYPRAEALWAECRTTSLQVAGTIYCNIL